jgi:lysozyme
METWGIDVSHYQGTVDWASVRGAGATFAFIKASEGATVADPQFANNWSSIAVAGLLRGAYHFGHPGTDPETQAVHFRSVVGALGPDDLPPVLDIETSDGHPASAVVAWVLAFLDKADTLFGRTLMIYTGGFWRFGLGDPVVSTLSQRALWVASYRPDAPLMPAGWQAWTFWQYTNGQLGAPGAVPGIAGLCDRNRYQGTVDQLQAFARAASAAGSAGNAPSVAATAGTSDTPMTCTWPGCHLVFPALSPLPSESVRTWQTRMNQLGFPVAPDGVYGSDCKAACTALQRERGLSPDGIVGPETWRATFAPNA